MQTTKNSLKGYLCQTIGLFIYSYCLNMFRTVLLKQKKVLLKNSRILSSKVFEYAFFYGKKPVDSQMIRICNLRCTFELRTSTM